MGVEMQMSDFHCRVFWACPSLFSLMIDKDDIFRIFLTKLQEAYCVWRLPNLREELLFSMKTWNVDRIYKVFDLKNYTMLYSISDEHVQEIKIRSVYSAWN